MANGHGGQRSGAGRPKGAISRRTRDAIERAKVTGELPHEFLLRVSRGEPIDGDSPSLQMRVDAAKAAAPYFAARLTVTELEVHDPNDPRLMTDEELEIAYQEARDAVQAIEKTRVRTAKLMKTQIRRSRQPQ